MVFDKGIAKKHYFLGFGDLTKIHFRNDRDQNLDEKLTATNKVEFPFDCDCPILEEDDFFFVKFKRKTVLEFGLNGQTDLEIGIGEIFDREVDCFLYVKVELSKVNLLDGLNELDFLHHDFGALQVDHYGLFFRTCDSKLIELVLMTLITLYMTDHTHLGHTRRKSKLTVGLNVIMLLIGIDHFI